MNIKFINKLPPKSNNILRICSVKTANCLVVNNYFDIIKLSENIKTIIKYNPEINNNIIFDIDKLSSRLIDVFIYRITQGLYKFSKYKTQKTINNVFFFTRKYYKKRQNIIDIVKSANFARDLINEPSNKMIPEKFAEYIKKYFKGKKNVNVKILNKNDITRLKLNLINAIGGYSKNKPNMIILDYKPKNFKKTICIAGKGVTIDTGGYSIKNVKAMNNMHMDKEGACISVSLFSNLVNNKNKNRIVCLCPLVENIISNESIKPRDVITAYNGQSVEIANIDAEGRLILADTLSYICKNYNPNYIIDIATFTNGGKYCHTSFSYFTTNEKLARYINNSSRELGENILRMPKWLEYMEYIKSDIADVKNNNFNCDKSEDLMASLFLMNFIEKKYRNNWIHFDIRMVNTINKLNVADGYGTILKIINKI